MSRIIQTEVFQYSELSDEAKAKARDWYRYSGSDDNFWSEATLEEFAEQAVLMGIELKERSCGRSRNGKEIMEPCIYWSGFSSQGDGACFEGEWHANRVKADKVADGWGEDPATTEIKRIAGIFAEIAKNFPHSSFTVKHRGHYYHRFCTDFDLDSGADYCEPEALDKYRTPEDPEGREGDDMARDRMIGDFPEAEIIEAARDLMEWFYNQLNKAYDYEQSDECVEENIVANEYEFLVDGTRKITI